MGHFKVIMKLRDCVKGEATEIQMGLGIFFSSLLPFSCLVFRKGSEFFLNILKLTVLKDIKVELFGWQVEMCVVILEV